MLVNNASSPHPAGEGMAAWTHSLQVDLLGTIYATRWAIEAMRRSGGGSIVNISSISALWHGRKTLGGFPGYDVAKLGVIRLTTGVAKDVAKEGIRLNCLAPGWIASDGPRQYWESLTPAQRAERGGPVKVAVDRGNRRDGLASGHGQIVEWAYRCVVVGRSATPDSMGRSGLSKCRRIPALY